MRTRHLLISAVIGILIGSVTLFADMSFNTTGSAGAVGPTGAAGATGATGPTGTFGGGNASIANLTYSGKLNVTGICPISASRTADTVTGPCPNPDRVISCTSGSSADVTYTLPAPTASGRTVDLFKVDPAGTKSCIVATASGAINSGTTRTLSTGNVGTNGWKHDTCHDLISGTWACVGDGT